MAKGDREKARREAAADDWFAAFALAYNGDDELQATLLQSSSKLALEHDTPRASPALPASWVVHAPVSIAEWYVRRVRDPEKLSVLARRDRRATVQEALLTNPTLRDDDVAAVARNAIHRGHAAIVARVTGRLRERPAEVVLHAFRARDDRGADTPGEVPSELRGHAASVCARVGDAAHWRLAVELSPERALSDYATGDFPEASLDELVAVLARIRETPHHPFATQSPGSRKAEQVIADAVVSGERLADDGDARDRVSAVLSAAPVGSLHVEVLVRALADDVRTPEVDELVDELVASQSDRSRATYHDMADKIADAAVRRCRRLGQPLRAPLARLVAASPVAFAASWGRLHELAELVDDEAVPALLDGNGRCRLAARIASGVSEGTRGEELLASSLATMPARGSVRDGDGELVVDHADPNFAAHVLSVDTSWRVADSENVVRVSTDVWRWLARHGNDELLQDVLYHAHRCGTLDGAGDGVGLPGDVAEPLLDRVVENFQRRDLRHRRSSASSADLTQTAVSMLQRVVGDAPSPPPAARVLEALEGIEEGSGAPQLVAGPRRTFLGGEWGATPSGDELAACLADDVVSVDELADAVDHAWPSRWRENDGWHKLPDWAYELADRLPTPGQAIGARGRIRLIVELLYDRVGDDPDRWSDAASMLSGWQGSIGSLVDTVAALGGDDAAPSPTVAAT